MLERDYEKTIAVQSLPEVSVMANNRGFIGFGDMYKAWAYRLDGDEDSALRYAKIAIEKLTSLSPTGSITDGFELNGLAIAYAFVGENELALATSRKAMATIPEDKDSFEGASAAEVYAQVLALTGNRDEALAEIERLLKHPTGFSRWELYLDPRWDFFRDDERFNTLIRPLDLDETNP
jgi:tetratricopeptide (TPR) repeat protein